MKWVAKSVVLKQGKYRLHLQKINRAYGGHFYTAKRSDARRQQIFQTYNDLKEHYQSWDDIDKIK